jgi:Tfp pilus assembly protein PilO|tara:strand:- start:31929 stop:32462 length:534 start_codon:yes stop_codon:yes gene_type:complete
MNSFMKYRWKIATGSVLVMCLVSIVFLLLPYISATLEQDQVLKSQKENIAYMTDWKGQLSEIERQREVLEKYVGTTESVIPSADDFPDIIEYLFTTSRRSNVKIQKLTPLESEQESLMERRVTIDFKGSYNGIAGFINKIEQSSYIARIERFELIKKDNEELSGSFEVSFILSGEQL